jgi:hypothetical protein
MQYLSPILGLIFLYIIFFLFLIGKKGIIGMWKFRAVAYNIFFKQNY